MGSYIRDGGDHKLLDISVLGRLAYVEEQGRDVGSRRAGLAIGRLFLQNIHDGAALGILGNGCKSMYGLYMVYSN